MRGVRVCALISVSDVSTAEYRGLVVPDPFFVSPVFLLLFLYHLRSDPFFFLLIFYINHAIVTLLYPFATSIQKKLYILYRIFTNNPYKFTHSFFLFLLIYSYSSSYSYYRFPRSSRLSSLSSFLHSLFFSLYFSSLHSFSFTFSLIFFVVQVFYEHRFLCPHCPYLIPSRTSFSH